MSDLKIRFLCMACPIILALACFGSVLFGDQQFGFRDAADFYYPLYQRVQQEWQAGRLPLWEPEENGGMPLLGNPTAAVLYPGKLIFAGFSYPVAVRLYVIGHLALAYLSMFSMLRMWALSWPSATVGALGYTFGAPVLLQYANVIFLVGAAWMPLGFLAADFWLQKRSLRALIALALILAMQTLGGDPQAAMITLTMAGVYAVGLTFSDSLSSWRYSYRRILTPLIGLYAGFLIWNMITHTENALADHEKWLQPWYLNWLLWCVIAVVLVFRCWKIRYLGLEWRILGLAAAAVMAFLISAVQVIPCLEFISHSLRSSTGAGTASIYSFSIHPARLIESIWPGFFGGIRGGNHRWLEALPPDHDYQIWIESLYLGGLTILLGCLALNQKTQTALMGWMKIVALVSVLLLLGKYGSPAFWYKASAHMLAQQQEVNQTARSDLEPIGSETLDGDGSPYWLLTKVIPGFSSFRYPGKFAVPACLALCGLAAMALESLLQNHGRRRLEWIGVAASGLSLVMLVFAFNSSGEHWLSTWFEGHPEWTTTAFGPMDAFLAKRAIRFALINGLLVGILALTIARVLLHSRQTAIALVLIGLTADLGLANSKLIYTVPQKIFEHKPRVLQLIEQAEANQPSRGPFRIHRIQNWSPAIWLKQNSTNRLEEIVAWEWESIRAKYAIPFRVTYTYAMGTTEWLDQVLFFDSFSLPLDEQAIQNFGLSKNQKIRYFTRRGFDLWNTRYFVLPSRIAVGSPIRGIWSFLPDTTEIDPPAGTFEGPAKETEHNRLLIEQDVQILRNEAAFPRAWIVHRARISKPVSLANLDARRPMMNEILYQDDELWHIEGRPVYDPHSVAWLEAEPGERQSLLKQLSGSLPDREETVEINSMEPQRVEMTATLRSAGLVVLADIFYPGWNLTIDGVPAKIHRVNRAMRGAFVTKGTHRLVYRYQPFSLTLGAVLSLVGIASLSILFLITSRPRHDRLRSEALGVLN